MRKGQIITIYEDPLTERKPEGEARLLRKIAENDEFEDWEVEFLDNGYVTGRVIQKNEEPCPGLQPDKDSIGESQMNCDFKNIIA